MGYVDHKINPTAQPITNALVKVELKKQITKIAQPDNQTLAEAMALNDETVKYKLASDDHGQYVKGEPQDGFNTRDIRKLQKRAKSFNNSLYAENKPIANVDGANVNVMRESGGKWGYYNPEMNDNTQITIDKLQMTPFQREMIETANWQRDRDGNPVMVKNRNKKSHPNVEYWSYGETRFESPTSNQQYTGVVNLGYDQNYQPVYYTIDKIKEFTLPAVQNKAAQVKNYGVNSYNPILPQSTQNSNTLYTAYDPIKQEIFSYDNQDIAKIKAVYAKYGDDFYDHLNDQQQIIYENMLDKAPKDQDGRYHDPITNAEWIDEIVTRPDGSKYVKIDNDIIGNERYVPNIQKQVKSHIRDNFQGNQYEVGETGESALVTRRTKNEIAHHQRLMSDIDYRLKARMAGNLDELINTMQDIRIVPNRKPGQKPHVKHYLSGRTEVEVDGELYYPRIDIEVGKNGQAIAYDIADIKRINKEPRAESDNRSYIRETNSVLDNQGSVSADNIPHLNQNVNDDVKFKLSQAQPTNQPEYKSYDQIVSIIKQRVADVIKHGIEESVLSESLQLNDLGYDIDINNPNLSEEQYQNLEQYQWDIISEAIDELGYEFNPDNNSYVKRGLSTSYDDINQHIISGLYGMGLDFEESRSWNKGPIPSRYADFAGTTIRVSNHDNGRVKQNYLEGNDYDLRFDDNILHSSKITADEVKADIADKMIDVLEDNGFDLIDDYYRDDFESPETRVEAFRNISSGLSQSPSSFDPETNTLTWFNKTLQLDDSDFSSGYDLERKLLKFAKDGIYDKGRSNSNPEARYQLNQQQATSQFIEQKLRQILGNEYELVTNRKQLDNKPLNAQGYANLKNHLVAVLDGKMNTGYHEAGHVVFNALSHVDAKMTNNAVESIIRHYGAKNLVKNANQAGYNQVVGHTLDFNNKADVKLAAEEQLMNDFAKYAEAKAKGRENYYARTTKLNTKIKQWFDKVITYLKDIVRRLDAAHNFMYRAERGDFAQMVDNKVRTERGEPFGNSEQLNRQLLSNSKQLKPEVAYKIDQDRFGDFVEISENVLEGVPEKNRAKVLKKYIKDNLQGNSYELNFGEDGKAKITRVSTHKIANPRQHIGAINKKGYIASELPDVMTISQKTGYSADKKAHSFAKDGFEYRQSRIKIGNDIYTVTLNVGLNGNGKLLYEINNIKKEARNSQGLLRRASYDTSSGRPNATTSPVDVRPETGQLQSTYLDDNIAQTDNNVKFMLDLDEDINLSDEARYASDYYYDKHQSPAQLRQSLIDELWQANKQGQGVDNIFVSPESALEDYKVVRASNNTPFYSGYYEANGKKPTKQALTAMIDDLLGIDNDYPTPYVTQEMWRDFEYNFGDIDGVRDAYKRLVNKEAMRAKSKQEAIQKVLNMKKTEQQLVDMANDVTPIKAVITDKQQNLNSRKKVRDTGEFKHVPLEDKNMALTKGNLYAQVGLGSSKDVIRGGGGENGRRFIFGNIELRQHTKKLKNGKSFVQSISTHTLLQSATKPASQNHLKGKEGR